MKILRIKLFVCSGMATLKNNAYIFDSDRGGGEFYYINGSTPIENVVCREIINTKKLTKITNLNSLKRKIIFPYYYVNNSAVVVPENEFKGKYPKAYSYFMSKKEILSTRDKGNGNYSEWSAYERGQSLEQYKYKLFFPHIAPSTPNFIISRDKNLLFYNGLSHLR